MSQASSAAVKPSDPAFDFTSLFARDLPPPAAKWGGFTKYHFIGGNNDADQLPLDGLLALLRVPDPRERLLEDASELEPGPLGILAQVPLLSVVVLI